MIIGDGIAIEDFAARRERVLRALNGSVAVVFAGDGGPPLSGMWEPDWNFYYLTGIRDEPGAAVLLDPKSEDKKRRCVLLLKPLNPEMEEWDGYRDRVSEALKARTGFQTVQRTNALARLLAAAARKRGKLACLHPFSTHEAPVSHDLAIYRKVAERTVGVSIEDRTMLLPEMRSVKSKAELAAMKRAAEATAAGFRAALAMIRPGVAERTIQRAIEDGFVSHGGSGVAYNSIVGAGINGTVLHYMANSGAAQDGDLIVIDAGAKAGGYCADVTRTFPAGGKFTKSQREVYSVVLRAMEAGIKAVRPGVLMSDVDAAARAIIDKAGYGDRFMHGIGHQLGIEVHDVTPDGPLKAGMVVTIEPGVYLPSEKQGIRIEDDILVTARGSANLTAMIPKSIADIESAMRRR